MHRPGPTSQAQAGAEGGQHMLAGCPACLVIKHDHPESKGPAVTAQSKPRSPAHRKGGRMLTFAQTWRQAHECHRRMLAPSCITGNHLLTVPDEDQRGSGLKRGCLQAYGLYTIAAYVHKGWSYVLPCTCPCTWCCLAAPGFVLQHRFPVIDGFFPL